MELFAQAGTDLTDAVLLVLNAQSPEDVTRLVQSRPYMLVPEFVVMLKELAKEHPRAVSSAGWRRIEDLSRLTEGEASDG